MAKKDKDEAAAEKKASKKGKETADDLIGDTGKRARNVMSGKTSGAGNSKGAAGAKGQGRQGQGAIAGARKKTAQSSVGERGRAKREADERAARGEGKYFFPSDDPERQKIRKLIEKHVKDEDYSTKQFAADHDVETWKVRLVAKQMSREKPALVRLDKSGDTGGVLLMRAPKGRSK